MSLFIDGQKAQTERVEMEALGMLTTQQVVGLQSSLMIATRTSGYHSRPHVHDCEQLNLVLAGEVWIFVGEVGYFLRKGDYLRVPANEIHWAWNRAPVECVLVESHSPALRLLADDRCNLLVSNSEKTQIDWADNYFVDFDTERVEQQVFSEENASGAR